jgi:plastocyanin
MKYRLIALAAFALLPLSATHSAAQPVPARVDIVLANFSFTPSAIQLKADKQVTLHFANQGSGGHDFTAAAFFKAANMDPATRAKLGTKGTVSLNKGQVADITLTPKAGTYKAKCSHFLHASLGMTGTVTVS